MIGYWCSSSIQLDHFWRRAEARTPLAVHRASATVVATLDGFAGGYSGRSDRFYRLSP